MSPAPEEARKGLLVLPPLALYIHIPWCMRKCPYCDFNSHAPRSEIPEAAYVERLLQDLEQEIAALHDSRPLHSIFIGGGTPSLFSGQSITRLLDGVRNLAELEPDAEITLEANPGTVDARHFTAYAEAGVNRLSIGAQSLSPSQLVRLGRIHGPENIRSAVALARRAGFTNLNLDLMYGLPRQSLDQAARDLAEALALAPDHLSYYQLTLEPNTAFHSSPPPLPEQDLIADIHQQGAKTLAEAGYGQYEISAYARAGRECRHNLNYWRFGDYLGIGAGAHGKVTDQKSNRIERRWKLRHPAAYLDADRQEQLTAGRRSLSGSDLIVEYAMNALRLTEGFAPAQFELRTGLGIEQITPILDDACNRGLMIKETDWIRPTELGQRFLNDLLQLFDQSES